MYAEKNDKNAKAFNCVQRGHQNVLESIPIFLALLFTSSYVVGSQHYLLDKKSTQKWSWRVYFVHGMQNLPSTDCCHGWTFPHPRLHHVHAWLRIGWSEKANARRIRYYLWCWPLAWWTVLAWPVYYFCKCWSGHLAMLVNAGLSIEAGLHILGLL